MSALQSNPNVVIAPSGAGAAVEQLDSLRHSALTLRLAATLVHGCVEVPGAHDTLKYTLAVPNRELEDGQVRMFIPGFGGFKRSSRLVRTALAEDQNFVGLSYEPARHGGTKNDLFRSQQVHIDTVGAILQDLPRNADLPNVANGNKVTFDKAHLVPHSMGGLPAAAHAVNHPEEVEQVINVATVGTQGAVMLGFVPRLYESGGYEIGPDILSGKLGGLRTGGVMLKRAVRYYGSNPLRTIGEMASCMNADTRPKLAALGALGVKVGYLALGKDRLIPGEEAFEAIKEVVDYGFVDYDLDHLAPQTHPHEVAANVAHITRELAKL